MKGKTIAANGLECDANIVRLVDAVNAIEGAETIASDGGHEQPKRGQLPEGEFLVTLECDPTTAGWRALAILASAADAVSADADGDVRLIAWTAPAGEDEAAFTLQFNLSGQGITPDKLAAEIKRRDRAVVASTAFVLRSDTE